jgi:hypothetical protein
MNQRDGTCLNNTTPAQIVPCNFSQSSCDDECTKTCVIWPIYLETMVNSQNCFQKKGKRSVTHFLTDNGSLHQPAAKLIIRSLMKRDSSVEFTQISNFKWNDNNYSTEWSMRSIFYAIYDPPSMCTSCWRIYTLQEINTEFDQVAFTSFWNYGNPARLCLGGHATILSNIKSCIIPASQDV